jgi:hypothetical protein
MQFNWEVQRHICMVVRPQLAFLARRPDYSPSARHTESFLFCLLWDLSRD